MLINKIKENLNGMSIYQLAEKMQMSYPACYKLVNRETLDASTFGSVVKVANILDLDLNEVYEMKKFRIMEATTLIKSKDDARQNLAIEEDADQVAIAEFDTLEDAKKEFEKYKTSDFRKASRGYYFVEWYLSDDNEDADEYEIIDVSEL